MAYLVETPTSFRLGHTPPPGVDLGLVTHRLDRSDDALPFEIALHITLSICETAAFVHERLGVGLDGVRLEEVTITPSGKVCLAAPRMRSGSGLVADDIYSIGVLLFALLAGRSPEGFVAMPFWVLANDGVPHDLVRIVAKAAHPIAGERYASMAELKAALGDWADAHDKRITGEVVAAFFTRYAFLAPVPPPLPRQPSLVSVAAPAANLGVWLWAAVLGLMAGGTFSGLLMI